MKRFIFLWMMSLTGLSACSLVHRAEQSGYAYREFEGPSTVEAFYQERYAKKYKEASSQLGLDPNRLHDENEVATIRNRILLGNLEKQISSNAEKKQYYDLKPYMRNDNERIYFLKLPDISTRSQWAQSRGVASVENIFDNVTQTLIEKSDIMKGMSRNAVKQSWGEPDAVEVAGNSLYGNERWIYKKLVSTEEGYKHETRYVYFETGRVAGWETVPTQ